MERTSRMVELEILATCDYSLVTFLSIHRRSYFRLEIFADYGAACFYMLFLIPSTGRHSCRLPSIGASAALKIAKHENRWFVSSGVFSVYSRFKNIVFPGVLRYPASKGDYRHPH